MGEGGEKEEPLIQHISNITGENNFQANYFSLKLSKLQKDKCQ